MTPVSIFADRWQESKDFPFLKNVFGGIQICNGIIRIETKNYRSPQACKPETEQVFLQKISPTRLTTGTFQQVLINSYRNKKSVYFLSRESFSSSDPSLLALFLEMFHRNSASDSHHGQLVEESPVSEVFFGSILELFNNTIYFTKFGTSI